MTKSEAKKLHCTVEAAIAVIGGKYKAIIIWWLNEKGVMRYSEIQRRVPQATKVYPVVPPKTEYALTDLGRATVPIVHAMDKWGADFFTRLGVPIPCDEEPTSPRRRLPISTPTSPAHRLKTKSATAASERADRPSRTALAAPTAGVTERKKK